MSQRGMQRFLEELKKDPALSAAFNEAVAKVATDAGYDVEARDVGQNTGIYFKPSAEPPKTDFSKLQPIVTTQAIGEEDFKGKDQNKGTPSVTCAIGEEDKKVPLRDLTDAEGEEKFTKGPDATTLALGEEDDHGRASVTCAIGEEDKNPKNPPPLDFTTKAVGEEEGGKPRPKDDEPHMTTMALGEEDNPPPPGPGGPCMTTMALGEEGNPPAPKPEGPRATTLALGEEGKKPRPNPRDQFPMTTKAVGEEEKNKSRREPQITTAAMGEEDGEKPKTVKRYIIPREDENGNTGPDITSMSLGEEEPKKKPGTPKP